MSAFSEFLMGSPERVQQIQKYEPNQNQAFNQMLGQGMQGLQSGGTAGFEPIATQARQDFQRQTIPSLAERFAGFGGGQQSSAYQQQLAQAGTDLDTRLAAMKSQYGLQSMNNYQNMANTGLTPQYEYPLRSATPSGIGQVLAGAASGFMAGNWPGAIAGALGGFGSWYSGQGNETYKGQQQQQSQQQQPQQQPQSPMQMMNMWASPTTTTAYFNQPNGPSSQVMPNWSAGNLTSGMANLSNSQRYAGVPMPTTPQFSFLH
jgi:hypothetical protein